MRANIIQKTSGSNGNISYGWKKRKRMNSRSSVDQVAAGNRPVPRSRPGIAILPRSTSNRHANSSASLSKSANPATGAGLAKATIYSRLMAVKAFFVWLAAPVGLQVSSHIYSDMDYFNPSNNDGRIARAIREKPALADARTDPPRFLSAMPTQSDIEKRDRAVFAFAILSGARDDAIASMLIRHVDLDRRTVFHDARDVRTTNRKTFASIFFPVGTDIGRGSLPTGSPFLTKRAVVRAARTPFPSTRVAVGATRAVRTKWLGTRRLA